MTGLEKFGAALLIVVIGLDLYGRWTGATFSIDLLHPNQLGKAITDANNKLKAAGGTK